MVTNSIFIVGETVKSFFTWDLWINLKRFKADLMVRLTRRYIWSNVMKHGDMCHMKNGYIGLYILWNL